MSSSEDALSDTIERMNTFIHRRNSVTLPVLLKELTTALKLLWKVTHLALTFFFSFHLR